MRIYWFSFIFFHFIDNDSIICENNHLNNETAKQITHSSLSYLVIRIHFSHHSFFQKVEGQYLQHVKLMRHLCFDRSISSNNMLEKSQVRSKAYGYIKY